MDKEEIIILLNTLDTVYELVAISKTIYKITIYSNHIYSYHLTPSKTTSFMIIELVNKINFINYINSTNG